MLFDSAEITGDVVVGEGSIIGAGVKIIGDSHGPVRIGARVQILENTVLHLLPDNELIVEDDVVIGPGAMIHGCHLGAGTVVEPAAIVCDFSRVGAGSIVRAGACVKQRARFGDRAVLDGFPARPGRDAGRRPVPPGLGVRPRRPAHARPASRRDRAAHRALSDRNPGARMTTGQTDPAPGAPNLLLPAQPPRAFAIYAFRGARTTGPGMPSALPSALADRGIGVLTLDLGSAPSRRRDHAEDRRPGRGAPGGGHAARPSTASRRC